MHAKNAIQYLNVTWIEVAMYCTCMYVHVGKHECWESLLYDDGLSSGSQFGSILCKCGNAQVIIKYTTTPDKINVPSR